MATVGFRRHVGDLSDDGFLFITDRVKDMVITGGENVYPAEAESVLFAHPAIAEVAVIGLPDERWGEAVTAVVVAEAEPPTLEELREFAGRTLARQQAADPAAHRRRAAVQPRRQGPQVRAAESLR